MRRPTSCNCRCKPPVNFRVFDFSDGTLLWERLLTRQYHTVGMDGRVWEMEAVVMRGTGVYSVGVTSSRSLPARYASDVSQSDISVYRAVSYDGGTGAVVTTSPEFTFRNFTVNGFGGFFQPSATRYTVNSSGHYIATTNGNAATVDLYIISNLQSTPVEYWFSNFGTSSGTINLTTSPASGTASFSITASAATIKSAIETAFSGLYNSVTVTAVAGTTILDGMIKVTIDWISSSSYINNMSISSRTQTVSSGIYDLEDGKLISRGGTSAISASYSQHGIWLNETKMIRRSSSAGDSTVPIVEVWDTSTNPWTSAWSNSYAAGHSTYVGGESKFPIGITARNGNAAVAMARMGSTPFSIKTYNVSGTVLTSKDFAYHPERITMSDDTDELSAMFLEHSWSQLCGAHGIKCGIAEYSTHDGAAYGIMDITGGSIEKYNSGQLAIKSGGSGFNSEMIAVVSDSALTAASASPFSIADSSGSTIDYNNLIDGPSGLSSPLAPANAHYQYWYIGTAPELLYYSLSWRLNFDSGIVTGWMDQDATLADINAELLTLFGQDIDSRQNVVASVWNTLPSYKTAMVPSEWQQYLKITARCARNSTEATASGMNLSLSSGTAGSVKRLQIESLGYTYRRTASIAALDRTDGTEVWSRGFSVSSPDSGCTGLLHNGHLYCSVAYTVGSTYPGEL